MGYRIHGAGVFLLDCNAFMGRALGDRGNTGKNPAEAGRVYLQANKAHRAGVRTERVVPVKDGSFFRNLLSTLCTL